MHSPSYAMHKTCRLRGKECTHVNEKVQNACNYLPDHWSFNFCVCFFFFFVVCVCVCQNRREWKEKTRWMKKKREKTSKKAWNKVREAGERHLTAVQLYFTTGVSQNRRRKRKRRGGVDATCQILREREGEKRRDGWREGGEAGQGSTGRTPPPPLSLSPLLHHSPSLPLSHRPDSSTSRQSLSSSGGDGGETRTPKLIRA